MLAIRERSVSLIAVSRATLIVVYTGVSLNLYAYRYRLHISFGHTTFLSMPWGNDMINACLGKY